MAAKMDSAGRESDRIYNNLSCKNRLLLRPFSDYFVTDRYIPS